ncbi:ABC-2 type transporter [Thermaerobacter marianensis DSM 12885]|uniref:Transport permease protein n=1 Tax=Thermaerobacter marianensis (strain ATCC 700841 / DSM 12885 / JCM 10246 / 7p75a) TaxID=644966 RepID=E6SHJ3_THEM7|nr:ABC transporter permease [Thermaerobacter marianensis]ADU51788.1 ABC-2 type transporter [Thermaerobacter marianensis DSM 12885]
MSPARAVPPAGSPERGERGAHADAGGVTDGVAGGPSMEAEPASRGEAAGALAARTGAAAFVRQTLAVVEAEVRKLRHDPVELVTRAVQPALWVLVFGQVMGRLRGIPTGGVPYLDFMAPGILAQSTLFVAIFYGISLIWERDLGILHKYMASPAPRTALVLGKALSAGVRGISQAVVIYLLAAATGVAVRHDPGALLGVLAVVVLGAAVFSTFSLIVACLVRTRERFMGIGQVLTMPLFFASNAIYPLSLMPGWLHGVARVNPLTYQVDALRGLMIRGGASQFGLGWDLGVLALALAVLVAVASRLYPRAVA